MTEIDRDAVALAVIDLDIQPLDGWANAGQYLTCSEVTALADLFVAVGLGKQAEQLMTGHFYGDGYESGDVEQEIEAHGDGDERDSRIVPELMWLDGEAPY